MVQFRVSLLVVTHTSSVLLGCKDATKNLIWKSEASGGLVGLLLREDLVSDKLGRRWTSVDSVLLRAANRRAICAIAIYSAA